MKRPHLLKIASAMLIAVALLCAPGKTDAYAQAGDGVPVWVYSSFLYLREGPGKLFAIEQTLTYHASLTALRAAPGRGWLYVQTEDGATGWVAAQYVKSKLSLEAVPLAEISPDWLSLKGSVKDSSGKPVVGALAVLYDGQNHGDEMRSWEDSYFYVFLPKEKQGTWNLKIVALDCSNVVTNLICHKPGWFEDNPRQVKIGVDTFVQFTYVKVGEKTANAPTSEVASGFALPLNAVRAFIR